MEIQPLFYGMATVSPPLRETVAFSTWGLVDVLMKRTEPSAIVALNPPGCLPHSKLRIGRIKRQVLGLRPGNGVRRLDEQERRRCAVGHARKWNPRWLAREHRAGVHDDLVRRHAWRHLRVRRAFENVRHPVDEGPVIGAVPRFVKVELVIETLIFQVGQDQHPPAQKWFSVGVASGRGWVLAVC